MNIAELSLANVERFGERTAVFFEDQQWTNVAMIRRAEKIATVLLGMGVKPSDRVLVMMYNCPEVMQVFQGLWRIGAVPVPVTPQWLASEVRYVIEHSGAKVVFTSPNLASKVREAALGISDRCRLLAFGKSDVVEACNIAPLIDGAAPWKSVYNAEPNEPALFIYTSGTTGRPKGVVLTHEGILANVEAVIKTLDPNPDTMTLYVLPLSHVFGVLCMNVGAIIGRPGVILNSFDAKRVFETIERFRVERFAVVPTMLTALLNFSERRQYDCSSLLWVDCGGAPLPEELRIEFERAFNCRVKEGYGCSEASCTLTAFHDDDRYRIGSVGRALPNVFISIQNDSGQSLDVEQEGEICAQGPNIMQGYWRDDQATREAIRDGWLHTGDIGKMDVDGFVYVTGRKKDLIIKGGENIAPRALEEALYEHPAIAEAAVIGIPDALYGEEICAVVVLRADKTATAEELKQHIGKYVSKFRIPATIVFRDSLPKSPVGKILKRELRTLLSWKAPPSGQS